MRNDAKRRRGRDRTPSQDAIERGQGHDRREHSPARRFRARPETLHPGWHGQFVCQPKRKINVFTVNNLAVFPSDFLHFRVQSVANCRTEPQVPEEYGGASSRRLLPPRSYLKEPLDPGRHRHDCGSGASPSEGPHDH